MALLPRGGAESLPYEVLCNNPVALSIQMYGGLPPSAPTPWVRPEDHNTGECRSEDGADGLHLAPVDDARDLNPSPDANWGLHLADVNIALGDLVELVRVQTRAYVRAQRRG